MSCIPRGTYQVRPFNGTKYKGVYILENVKDRSYILIHTGNFLKDTQGCILVGLSATAKDGEPVVYSSKAAFELLKLHAGREFQLSIF